MARRSFLAFFLLTSCLVSGQSPRYVLKGQKVTLKKDITGRPDNILWTHNGNKVVEFNGREEHVYDPYKTRVTLDRSSAELNITDLRLEDSGKYELEIFVNKKLEKSHHDVEVLDRVAKPTISCKINNSNNSGTLVCSAEPRQPVHLRTFEWYSQESVHPGPHLQISLGHEHDDKVYSCTVRNPLTTETAAFTAKDCHTTKSSSVILIVTVIVMSLLLLLLIVGAVILYYCKKQKGCFEKRQTDSTDSTDSTDLEKQKQCVTKGEAVKTDETMPLIDGQPSGKSSAGVKDHFSEAPEKEEGHASNELPAESDDVNQDASSEEKPSTLSASSGTVEHSVNTDKSDSDREESSKVQPGKATDTAAVGPDTGPAGQNEDEIKKRNTPVEDNLGQAPDEQKGHPLNKSESPAESADQNTEQNYTTAPAPGYVKELVKKIDSNTNTDGEKHLANQQPVPAPQKKKEGESSREG